MPLFIRDESVNDLAEKAARLLGKTKTDAVRLALESHIEALQSSRTLAERVASLQARARALGLVADGFDDKPLMDDLSGGL